MMIPESVAAYLQDGGVRRAINELRDIGSGGVLDGLDWAELPRFYRALQASRQFETEWAILACELWEETWGGLLAGWHQFSPEQQVAAYQDAGLAVDELLATGDGSLWFGRVLTDGGRTLYAAVSGVPGQGFVLKVACGTDRQSIQFSSVAAKADDLGNWVSAPVPIEDGAIDVKPLRAVAVKALTDLSS